jgi:EmrB/QacA subfamily drug resistance transporter
MSSGNSTDVEFSFREAAMTGKWGTLVAVCVGTFMLLLDITIVMVVLPEVQRGLGATLSDLQWVVDAYALTLAALLLAAGSLADRFGRRRLYLIGVAIFSTASLFCGLAGSPLFLIVARAIQGTGGAIMFATALALLGNTYRGRDRDVAFGVWGGVTGIAVGVGPVLGGALSAWLSWRWIFFINLPVAAAAIAITRRGTPESRDPDAAGVDWAGVVTFSAALTALVLGLIRGNPDGWGSPAVVGCLIASPLLIGAFLIAEHRAQQPMFDLSLFRKPAFCGGAVAAFAVSGSILALLLYLVIYLQNVLGYSALGAGVRLLCLSGAILVFGAISGRLASRVPARLLLGGGLALVGAGLLLMRGLTASSDWTALVAGLIVSGAGVGLVNPALASTAVDVVPPNRAGMGSGINSTFRQVGIATGIAALGAVFQQRVSTAVVAGLEHVAGVPPALAQRASEEVVAGRPQQALGAVPGPARATAAHVARSAFTGALDDILLIAAVVALAGAVLAAMLVRARDFLPADRAATEDGGPGPAPGRPAAASAAVRGRAA